MLFSFWFHLHFNRFGIYVKTFTTYKSLTCHTLTFSPVITHTTSYFFVHSITFDFAPASRNNHTIFGQSMACKTFPGRRLQIRLQISCPVESLACHSVFCSWIVQLWQWWYFWFPGAVTAMLPSYSQTTRGLSSMELKTSGASSFLLSGKVYKTCLHLLHIARIYIRLDLSNFSVICIFIHPCWHIQWPATGLASGYALLVRIPPHSATFRAGYSVRIHILFLSFLIFKLLGPGEYRNKKEM